MTIAFPQGAARVKARHAKELLGSGPSMSELVPAYEALSIDD